MLGSGLLGSLPESATLGQATSYPCSAFKVWRPSVRWTWKNRKGLKSWGAARTELGCMGLFLQSLSCRPHVMVELASSTPTATTGALFPRREEPAAST